MSTQLSFGQKALRVLETLGIYFISLVMISFATTKFLNTQFIIFHYQGHIPLKDISPFTHAWSFLGRSYPYNLFLGITEFLVGALILFKRTRLVALLLGVGLYTNILIIDIEFQVKQATVHAAVEFVIILLLLLPYLKDLKTFFWDNMGKLQAAAAVPTKTWKAWVPVVFLVALTAGFLVEGKMFIDGQDKLMGEYQLNHVVVNQDTLVLTGGKYTAQPMIFFEFANNCIVSVNEKSLWADYNTQKDSIHIRFDKDLEGIKTIKGKLDRAGGKIIGQTDKGLPIYLQFSKPLPTPKK